MGGLGMLVGDIPPVFFLSPFPQSGFVFTGMGMKRMGMG